jgi:hypothetical protein
VALQREYRTDGEYHAAACIADCCSDNSDCRPGDDDRRSGHHDCRPGNPILRTRDTDVRPGDPILRTRDTDLGGESLAGSTFADTMSSTGSDCPA